MLRYMVGYPVWCKRDMLAWLIDGIRRSFDPKRTEVLFYFDACVDECQSVYNHMREFLLVDHGFKESSFSGNTEILEVGGHRKLIELFMQSDCDVLIVPQDDQRLEAPLIPPLDALFSQYGDKIGVIGGRDGFFTGYGEMASSEWSESTLCKTRLKHGMAVERPYLNSGPVIYNRKLIEAIGLPDDGFKAFYVWDDYSERARRAGFKNFAMGMDLIHGKFGKVVASKLYQDGIEQHDRERLRAKWGL